MALLGGLVLFLQSSAFAQCFVTTGPTNDCAYGDAIDAFSLAGVPSNNPGCSGAQTGYTYFTTPVRSLTIGQSYPWSAAVGGATYNQGMSIWIDLNGNGQFESSEQVATGSPPALNHSGSLTIPGTATAGTVRMRVMCTYNTTPAASAACTSNIGNYGETEDYDVELVAPGVPVIGAAKQMSATGTGPYTVTIDYRVENLGDVGLSSLSAPDDLTAVFGATPANWTLTSIAKLGGPATFDANAGFTGSPGSPELINAGSSLAPGEVGQIRVVISVTTPGSYQNQITATGMDPTGAPVSDLSTDGTDPDPNGDGDPSESTPSIVAFEHPVIGTAKQMSATGTGPYTVTIDYRVENLGDVGLSSLSAPDDLTAVFGATPANWTLTSIAKLGGPATFDANAGFTGSPGSPELINAGSSLAPGEVGQIRVVISVTTPGSYQNQVTAGGDSPGGAPVSDLSTDGTDPDPNGDGDPSESTPSIVAFEHAVIGAAKQMGAAGTNPFTVTIDYTFENFGDVSLGNLSASDDLTAVFGATPADWSFTSIAKLSGPASFDANAAFTGTPGSTELINAGSSLAPGEVGQIEVVLSVTVTGTFTNQVTVGGESPLGATVTDDSDAGTDPDANGDGVPDEGGPASLELRASILEIPALDRRGLAALGALLALAALGALALRRR